jgi:HSP20 family molecular chaperone IbpA
MRYALRQKYDYPAEEEDELLLRYGAGRFGSFSEKWRIDSDSTDPDGIEASFERGNLQLVIPKVQQKRRAQPRYSNNRGYGESPFYW